MKNKLDLIEKIFLTLVLLIQVIFTLGYFCMHFESKNMPFDKEMYVLLGFFSWFLMISWFFAIMHFLLFFFREKIKSKFEKIGKVIALALCLLIYVFCYMVMYDIFIGFIYG